MDLLKEAECSMQGPVKKDLLTTAGANIVLVCLETGPVIPPHPEPYAVVFVVLQGDGVITVGTREHPVQPFHLVLVLVLVLVSVRKDEDRGIRCNQKMIILSIRDDV